jgi:molybdopterin synthase catalytic subunit
MIEVTDKAISPEMVITKAKSDGSGCLVIYTGLIRNRSHGKQVLSVEYQDTQGNAKVILQEFAEEARRKWQIENVAITHRIGKLYVGDINLVIVVASAHRREGFAACRYIIHQFKRRLPTKKTETYQDNN